MTELSPAVLAAALALAVYSLAVLWGYAPVRHRPFGGKRIPVYVVGWRAVLKRLSFLGAAVLLGVFFVRWALAPSDWPLGVVIGLAVVELGPSLLSAIRTGLKVAARALGKRFGGGQ